MELLINIDVPDLERAIAFYCAALGLEVERRLFGGDVVELAGGTSRIYLLRKPAGTPSSAGTTCRRDYDRHWTPIHFDVVVGDVEDAARRAQAAGAHLEGEIQTARWGRLAVFGDPFGHGFCLVEFRGRGYGEVEEREA
jgi:predicted enzyme related to lactoylglutathione lyase